MTTQVLRERRIEHRRRTPLARQKSAKQEIGTFPDLELAFRSRHPDDCASLSANI
jgi:hypothetical protein